MRRRYRRRHLAGSPSSTRGRWRLYVMSLARRTPDGRCTRAGRTLSRTAVPGRRFPEPVPTLAAGEHLGQPRRTRTTDGTHTQHHPLPTWWSPARRWARGGLVVGLAVGGLGGWTASHASARADGPAATASATPTRPPATRAHGHPGADVVLGLPASEAPGARPRRAASTSRRRGPHRTACRGRGRLLHETIPATTSHFAAGRPSCTCHAALTADPPHLPVDVLLSGQSRGAGPNDVQSGGQIEQTMDALATSTAGSRRSSSCPDQLGRGRQTMCVDGKLGNSRTYLTRDVPAWITSHLKVQTAAAAWTIGGFSQGGTCAIQLGAGDPSASAT